MIWRDNNQNRRQEPWRDRARRFMLAGVMVAGFCLAVPAAVPAAELDPFNVDPGTWISPQRFREKEQRFPPPTNKAAIPLPQHPEEAPPPSNAATAPIDTTVSPAAKPAPRLNLTTLPGMNKGFDVRVDTTMEDSSIDSDSDGKGSASQNQSPISDEHWRNAKDVAHESVDGDAQADDDKERLNIRLATLPNRSVAPTKPHPSTLEPSPNGADTAKKSARPKNDTKDTRTADEAAKEKKTAMSKPSDAAALAALAALRKRQMEALASDRETLRALQQAIKDLGLEKKLDFVGNASNTLTADTPDMHGAAPAPAGAPVAPPSPPPSAPPKKP